MAASSDVAVGGSQSILALIGPTGSGKSDIAMRVAESLTGERPVEIVAIDAFTVYRGMDIGTATPSPEDRARVPHHMVDELDPEEECSVRWFQDHAREAIAQVRGRGSLPLLVGGSGLYYRAVVDDLAFPPTDAAVREALQKRWADDPAAAHQHLAHVDPAAAGRIDPLNLRRTVRALEVMELTGRPFSSFRTAWTTHSSIYPGLQVLGVNIDRPTLVKRLEARTSRMLASGWLDEARSLRARSLQIRALQGQPLSETAGQAIGYAELFRHLEGSLGWEDMVERIIIRTRQFAIRQLRWFGKDPRVAWIGSTDMAGEVVRRATDGPDAAG